MRFKDVIIGEELEDLIAKKVNDSLKEDENFTPPIKRFLIVGGIDVSYQNDTVDLVVSTCSKEITISFDRKEFNRLLHINSEKVIMDTFRIADIELSDEQCEIIKRELIITLERYDDADFRKCEKINIEKITKLSSDDPEKLLLELKLMYSCPIEGHCTPDMTKEFKLWLDKSEFEDNPCKRRHIAYSRIDEKELPQDDMIVLEKIDGSNLGIGFIDEGTIIIQSRKRVLALLSIDCLMEKTTVQERSYGKGKSYDVEMAYVSKARDIIADKKFFDLEFIIDDLIKKIIKIRNKIEYVQFMVFGELFGSSKHPRKDDKKKSHLLQYHSEESKRLLNTDKVFYSAFDILINNEFYLRYSDAINIFREVELPYCKTLDIEYCGNEGILKEIETIQSQFATEPAEGVIVKKDEDEKKHKRTITKLKRKAFCETRGTDINVKNFLTINRLLNSYTKCGGDEKQTIECFVRDVEEEVMKSVKKIEKEATTYAKINMKNIK